MVLTSLLLTTLAAGPIKLAAPGFNAVDVDEKRADFLVDYLADQLTAQGGVRVTTKSEISALIGMERQKALLGCDQSSSSCLAELAGALGVDGVIVGNVVKVGRGFAATVKIVRAQSGDPIVSTSGRFDNEGKLLDWLRESAPSMMQKVRDAFAGRAAPASPTEATGTAPTVPATTPSASLSQSPAPSTAAGSGAPGAAEPQRNRFIVGLASLGYERHLTDWLGLGIHVHALAGPKFLFWPDFAIGAYGGLYLRLRPIAVGPVELSVMGTVGYGGTQDYELQGDTPSNVGIVGWLVAPAVELSAFNFRIAGEVPLHFYRTYESVDELRFPFFIRLSYAIPF